ncbi:MAG TPA: hypothetical protein PKH24_19020, partial [Sedimentisphaerales bacterium]|nr:hypothetical protein [Sedimentisphaerales bacterium]
GTVSPHIRAAKMGSPDAHVRPDEWRRIQCGAAHFGSRQLKKPGALIGVDFQVVPDAGKLT